MSNISLKEAIEHLNDVLSNDKKWECEECRNEHVVLREFLKELQQYRSIGTVEECREAAEGQRAKKVIIARARNEKEVVSKGDYVHYKCPNCEKIIGSAFYYPPNEYMMGHKFCDNCGQAISWEESEGEDV